jgi:small subunit ribosomal protein S6
LRNYELVYIAQPDLDDEALKALAERIQQVIVANGGQVTSTESMGRRTLAYPIKRRRDGYYILIKASLTQKSITELERSLRLSEDVLRHMLVHLEDEPAAPIAAEQI